MSAMWFDIITTSTRYPTMNTTETASVLTLYEAAEFLRVSERTLWQLAREQQVPHFRVGRQYRFVSTELLAWATSKEREV